MWVMKMPSTQSDLSNPSASLTHVITHFSKGVLSGQKVPIQDEAGCKVFHICTVCYGKYSSEVLKLNSLRYDAQVLEVEEISLHLFSNGNSPLDGN